MRSNGSSSRSGNTLAIDEDYVDFIHNNTWFSLQSSNGDTVPESPIQSYLRNEHREHCLHMVKLLRTKNLIVATQGVVRRMFRRYAKYGMLAEALNTFKYTAEHGFMLMLLYLMV
jgi:hypothetical protein